MSFAEISAAGILRPAGQNPAGSASAATGAGIIATTGSFAALITAETNTPASLSIGTPHISSGEPGEIIVPDSTGLPRPVETQKPGGFEQATPIVFGLPTPVNLPKPGVIEIAIPGITGLPTPV
ncbi:hypothetical protein MNBD_ALPHA06-586, partial [hydrothermal vent metagenome]